VAAEVLERALQPAGRGTAIPAVRAGDLPGVHGQALAVGELVVERDVELVLGDDEPGRAEGAGNLTNT
jgi:hypothetical protein